MGVPVKLRACAILAAAVATIACGDTTQPCADISGRCIALHVLSEDIDQIDQLEIDALYGETHDTFALQSTGGQLAALPWQVAVQFEVPADRLRIGLVAAGKRSGVVLGAGAVASELGDDEQIDLMLTLSPPGDCVAGGFYCGGDKLAGLPDTLYECNGGGVPLARGVCAFGCVVDPGRDDGCSAGDETCVEGGFYCGGDKVVGDPRTLYRCEGGQGVDGVECADGCVVAPAGTDDHCR